MRPVPRFRPRTRASALAIAAAVLVALFAIEPRAGTATQDEQLGTFSERKPVALGSLVGRGHEVVIEATADGPRYTVKSDAGVIVAERLTFETLAERFPELAPGDWHADAAPAEFGPIMMVPDDGP
ncbi:MAG: hypothetical protein AAFX79_07570 [Planctomycetota bacterium]